MEAYMCTRNGLIYMFQDGRVIERPKRLYGEEIEREMSAMKEINGYVQVEPEEFDRIIQNQPHAKGCQCEKCEVNRIQACYGV
jgi:hypothetical protein